MSRVLAFLLLAFCFGMLGEPSAQNRQASSATPSKNATTKRSDGTRSPESLPQASYDNPAPTDQAERTRREKKNRRYSGTLTFRFNDDEPGALPGNVSIHTSSSPREAVPVSLANAVVIGPALQEHAYLTDDKTGIYTETTIRIDQILKQSSANALRVGDVVTTDRWGGAVLLPSGRVKTIQFEDWELPTPGKTYIWFLVTRDDDSDFATYTAYEIDGGAIEPLDPCYPFDKYKRLDSNKFVGIIKDRLGPRGE